MLSARIFPAVLLDGTKRDLHSCGQRISESERGEGVFFDYLPECLIWEACSRHLKIIACIEDPAIFQGIFDDLDRHTATTPTGRDATRVRSRGNLIVQFFNPRPKSQVCKKAGQLRIAADNP
jgi:hypothetical protein